MTVKTLLIILTALSGCNLCYSQVTNNWTCPRREGQFDFHLECHDLENHSLDIYFKERTLHIKHITRDVLLLHIDMTTFPKQQISQELRNNNQELRGIKIENCGLPDGNASFSTLLGLFGVEKGFSAFEGINISPPVYSLDGRFSSGFEKVKKFTLHDNIINQFNDKVFQSMPEISNLDLSQNNIANLDRNVFEKLTKLKTLDLSWNKLTTLSEGMFKNQGHLTVLFVKGNRLTVLTKEMFQGLKSLNVLLFNGNFHSIHLKDDVFHHLPSLRQISLGSGNMEVPYAIFSKQSQLEYVFLEQVKLANGLWLSGLNTLQIKSSEVLNISGLSNITNVTITDGILNEALNLASFKNLSSTTKLDLSSNRIGSLVDGLFDEVTELVELFLSTNQLTSISGLVFGKLQKLIEIDISNNLLTTIHPDAFENNSQLATINLQNNRLSFKDDKTPFIHVTNLKFLDLTNNLLTRIPAELMETKKLEILILSKNQISSVTFSEIRQNYISLNSEKEFEREGYGNAHINLDGNPLACDCGMFDFLTGTDQKTLAPVFCPNDLELCSHKSSLNDGCPSGYSCQQTESFRHVIISSNDTQLARLPEIEFMNATSIQLNISHSSLKELPLMNGNLRVTFIQASHNHISKIGMENLPSTIRGIDLSHNEIRTIAADVIRFVMNHKSLKIFFLKKNPLECDCRFNDTEQLIKFTNENGSMTDLQGAYCDNIYELSTAVLQERCKDKAIMNGLVGVTILLMIFAAVILLFIKHREFIKAWLYAHDWFLWWVNEEHLDKVYDVFISYAHENRMLAYRITHALEILNTFKVCLHERDFVVGEEIEKQVQRAVRNSRRTLVILSESYLASVWCRHEFRLAWTRSVAKKRKLLIAVKDGSLGEVTDEIIQAYIKTHTYIESRDQWFWEKLIFRLPHKKTSKNIFPIRDWNDTTLDMCESKF